MRPSNKILERHYGKNYEHPKTHVDQNTFPGNAPRTINKENNIQNDMIDPISDFDHHPVPQGQAPGSTYDGGNPYLYPSQVSQQDSLNQQKISTLSKFNCSGGYVRLSTSVFPKSNKLQRELAIPLTAIIQPYGNISYVRNLINL